VMLGEFAVAKRVAGAPFWRQVRSVALASIGLIIGTVVGLAISSALAPVPALLLGLPACMLAYLVVVWVSAPDVRRVVMTLLGGGGRRSLFGAIRA